MSGVSVPLKKINNREKAGKRIKVKVKVKVEGGNRSVEDIKARRAKVQKVKEEPCISVVKTTAEAISPSIPTSERSKEAAYIVLTYSQRIIDVVIPVSRDQVVNTEDCTEWFPVKRTGGSLLVSRDARVAKWSSMKIVPYEKRVSFVIIDGNSNSVFDIMDESIPRTGTTEASVLYKDWERRHHAICTDPLCTIRKNPSHYGPFHLWGKA